MKAFALTRCRQPTAQRSFTYFLFLYMLAFARLAATGWAERFASVGRIGWMRNARLESSDGNEAVVAVVGIGPRVHRSGVSLDGETQP